MEFDRYTLDEQDIGPPGKAILLRVTLQYKPQVCRVCGAPAAMEYLHHVLEAHGFEVRIVRPANNNCEQHHFETTSEWREDAFEIRWVYGQRSEDEDHDDDDR